MTPIDLLCLVLLSALWGASYLFMRLGVGEFGPEVFAGLRAALAALILLPILWRAGQWRAWRGRIGALVVVGVTQSALPFLLFSFAAPRIPTGLSAILGATTPLFTAIMAWAWMGERLGVRRALGLGVGFGGVVLLASQKSGFALASGSGAWWAMAACVGAAMGYGFSANYTKRFLTGAPILAVATGTQWVAALALAPVVARNWPSEMPSAGAWGALLVLAVFGTALAYLLFFRLIARVGPSRTVTVAFLVPVFGVLWGRIFLGEPVSIGLLVGGVIVLGGTALTVFKGAAKPPLVPTSTTVLSSASQNG